MGRRYQNDTIVEALCEFRFKPETPWDTKVYGQFYEQVKDEYPQSEEAQDLETTLGRDEGGQVVQSLRRTPRMRFYTSDRTRLLQLGERLLVVNVLKPYPHWDEFKRIVFQALDRWHRMAEQPPAVEQTTLRYIDRFQQNAEGFRLGEWINCGDAYFPKALERQSMRATSQIRHEVSGDDRFSIGLKLWPVEDGAKREVTLDTEYASARVGTTDREALEPELDEMHRKIIEAFESSITDRTRRMMDAEQEARA